MRYLEMGLAFASIGFVVASTAISLLTVVLWRSFRPWLRGAGPLFVLRMLPTIGAAGLVLGLVVPAYLYFEPRDTAERAGPALAILVVLAGALVVPGWIRVVKSWLDTRRLERAWRRVAVPTACPGLPLMAYRVPSEMPLAALVGVLHPRLFVSDRFFDSLSTDERRAVVQHEAGHLLSFDNLKRVLIRLAPDWLSFSRAGRQIEAAWGLAVEEAADDHAAGPDGAHALEVAGALLKASRFAPTRCDSVSNFCDGATIARRVARLLADPPEGRGSARRSVSRYVWIPALLGAAALLAASALPAAYGMTEAVVRVLQ